MAQTVAATSLVVALSVLVACAESQPNAISTLPTLRTVPRSVPVQLQTTTTTANVAKYTVRKGDTLSMIARAYGVDMDDLAAYNNIPKDKYDLIQDGQVLTVPNPVNPSGTFAP